MSRRKTVGISVETLLYLKLNSKRHVILSIFSLTRGSAKFRSRNENLKVVTRFDSFLMETGKLSLVASLGTYPLF